MPCGVRRLQALVAAGVKDINRPAEKLSPLQSGGTLRLVSPGSFLETPLTSVDRGGAAGLALTGIIWSRYSTQIIPVNYSLLTVNVFVAATGLYQCYRIWKYVRFFVLSSPAPFRKADALGLVCFDLVSSQLPPRSQGRPGRECIKRPVICLDCLRWYVTTGHAASRALLLPPWPMMIHILQVSICHAADVPRGVKTTSITFSSV